MLTRLRFPQEGTLMQCTGPQEVAETARASGEHLSRERAALLSSQGGIRAMQEPSGQGCPVYKRSQKARLFLAF